jgi:spore coat polysaccharide biosynthesis predicted glycosyltransferase SpsG
MKNKLKLLFYTFRNKHTGYGHWFRSLALAEVAQDRGHEVLIASNTEPPFRYPWEFVAYDSPTELDRALSFHHPDWLVIDLPDTLPGWIQDMAKCKICVLNGIGYDQAEGVDLRVIQGVADLELPKKIDTSNTIMGLEYIILRPEIARYRSAKKFDLWFIWGGGNDHLSLLDRFGESCQDKNAVMILNGMAKLPKRRSQNHLLIEPESPEAIFNPMAYAQWACVAMGMVVPELIYLNVSPYVFSFSELHLKFAQGMERYGLIKAFPQVGLPGKRKMRAFLEEPFPQVGENKIDGWGAERVVEEIERR